MTRIFIVLAAIAATVLYAVTPPAIGFAKPESTRILLFHVPEAMLCGLFFLWGAIMAVRYLLDQKNVGFDHRSLAAIEVGTLLCVLATLTGMVFAYEQWGVAWDWDPRQTTIFVQLLIYAAYFALRTAFNAQERARAASAAYAIFAFLTVPVLIWILPRLMPSKHAGANQAVVGGGLDSTYRIYFYSCLLIIAIISIWCYTLRVRQADDAAKLDNELDPSNTADSGVVRPVRIRDVDRP